MYSHSNKIWSLALMVAVTGLVHCGKKSKSQDVEISLTPEAPVVITSDLSLSIGGTTKTVKGPWFKFLVKMNNKSDEAVTIVALHVEVTGMGQSGMLETVKKDFDPGMWNYSTLAGTCSYGDFGEFTPGGDATGTGGKFNNLPIYITSASTSCTGSGGSPYNVYFYFAEAPKPVNGSNYRYTLKIQPMGWFGTRFEPTDRFDGFTIGNTQ